ncbi:MAG: hypothetical protein U0103_16925 [Candidatus Obscuribacterales bacterium]
MIYIDSENAKVPFDQDAFLANLAKKVADNQEWCACMLEPYATVLVCHWSACETLNWVDRLLGTVPVLEEMPLQYRLTVEWLKGKGLKYRIVHIKDRTRVEVQAPKDPFLSRAISRFENLLAHAKQSRANAPLFECGDREEFVNALVVDWDECFRTFKQMVLRRPPLEKDMPEHAQWVLDWLRSNGYVYEIDSCGGFQERAVNWGIFVNV